MFRTLLTILAIFVGYELISGNNDGSNKVLDSDCDDLESLAYDDEF
ncbi:MAG: hypothetical protein AB1782_18370 [Cyanobacteriota bacterium]